MFHLSFSSMPVSLDFVRGSKVLLKSNNQWRLLFLRSDVPISLQKLFRTSLMWSYAATSLKRLLIEDHQHHAYARLYIQGKLGEAQLGVSLSIWSIPQSLLQSSQLDRVTSNSLTRYLGIHTTCKTDLQCTNNRISLWYHPP